MSRSESPTPSLPEPMRAILDLFAGPLAEVRFPDLDADRLHASRAVVESKRAALQDALAQVQAARAELDQAQATLDKQARRAHAYATIYAQDDPTLAEQLAAIPLSARRLAPKKRRSGKRKDGKAGKEQTKLAVAEDAA